MIEAIRQGLKADSFNVSIVRPRRWFEVSQGTDVEPACKSASKVWPELAEPIRAIIEPEPSSGG